MRKCLKQPIVYLGILIVLLASPSLLQADKIYTAKKTSDGKIRKDIVNGKITKDGLDGINFSAGGAGGHIARLEVAKVVYAAFPKALANAQAALVSESYSEARSFLAQSGSALKALDPEQRNLILQYAFYYRAQVEHKLGNYAQAIKYYGRVLTVVPDSVFYFKAKTGEARALEEMGQGKQALSRYQLLQADFTKRAKDMSLPVAQYKPAVFICALGELRVKVQLANAAGDVKSRKIGLTRLEATLETLVHKNKVTRESGDAARRIKALIWKGMEDWPKLINFLNKVILEGQLADRRAKLGELVKTRADANYASKNYRAASIDYLRLWLEYNISGPVGAESHYKLSQCLLQSKDKGWERMTMRHLALAKVGDYQPWAERAAKKQKEIKAIMNKKK